MPEADRGFYTDWFNGGRRGDPSWETYFLDTFIELYAPASGRAALVDEHALTPGAGPALIRWVRDDLWPQIPRRENGSAPERAVLVDLLESDDPRARRVAARALSA